MKSYILPLDDIRASKVTRIVVYIIRINLVTIALTALFFNGFEKSL